MNKAFWTNTYQANIGKLVGICYRYTGDYQLSEDLAHDAFLKAIEKSESFRGDGDFDAWLRRIVVNHVLQYIRNQKKNPYLQQLTPDQAAVIAAQEDTSSTGAMELSTVELLETINQLPEHHKLVFNLYVMEKFSHAQIGEALGISEGTSKSHLARARKKLQHLLTEKITGQKEKGNEKRAAILLLAVANDASMDKIYHDGLDQFSIPPKSPLPFDFSQLAGKNPLKKIVSKKSIQIIVTGSAVLAATLVILFISKGNHQDQQNKTNSKTSFTDTTLSEKNKENSPPQVATISPDSINTGRNKKIKKMKPLDSLALMLALATGTIHTSPVIDSIKNQTEQQPVPQAPASNDSSIDNAKSKPTMVPDIDPSEGTFRASELYWRKDNMEVYFKGQVRVDFKDQHFHGNGSFTFLGKVYLLLVDDQQVASNKTIKLSAQDYHLTVLDSTEASSKYGDSGKNGAILIYRSK